MTEAVKHYQHDARRARGAEVIELHFVELGHSERITIPNESKYVTRKLAIQSKAVSVQ